METSNHERERTNDQPNQVNFENYSQAIRNFYLLDYLVEEEPDTIIIKNEKTENGSFKLKTNLIEYANQKIEKQNSERYIINMSSIQKVFSKFPEEYRSTLRWIFSSFLLDMSKLTEDPFIQEPYTFNHQVQSYLIIHCVIIFKSKYQKYSKDNKTLTKKEIITGIRTSFADWLKTYFQDVFHSYYELISMNPFFEKKGVSILFLNEYHYGRVFWKMEMPKFQYVIFNLCYKTLPSTKNEWDNEISNIKYLLNLLFNQKVENWETYPRKLSIFHLSSDELKIILDEIVNEIKLFEEKQKELKEQKQKEKQEKNAKLKKEKQRNECFNKLKICIKKIVFQKIKITKKKQEESTDKEGKEDQTTDQKIDYLFKQIEKQNEEIEKQRAVNEKQNEEIEKQRAVNEKQNEEIENIKNTYEEQKKEIENVNLNVQQLQDTISNIQLRDYFKRCFFYFGDMFNVFGYRKEKFEELKSKISNSKWSETHQKNVIFFIEQIYNLLNYYNSLSHELKSNPLDQIKKCLNLSNIQKNTFNSILENFLTIQSFKSYFDNDECLNYYDFYKVYGNPFEI